MIELIPEARKWTAFSANGEAINTGLHPFPPLFVCQISPISYLFLKFLTTMAYTDDSVKAKLSALNETQEGIVTVAQWVMFHRYNRSIYVS